MTRTLVLAVSLAIVCLLGVLTVVTAARHGIDILVVLSFILLALLAVGVIGALGADDDG